MENPRENPMYGMYGTSTVPYVSFYLRKNDYGTK